MKRGQRKRGNLKDKGRKKEDKLRKCLNSMSKKMQKEHK
jgi:hypothetical protein